MSKSFASARKDQRGKDKRDRQRRSIDFSQRRPRGGESRCTISIKNPDVETLFAMQGRSTRVRLALTPPWACILLVCTTTMQTLSTHHDNNAQSVRPVFYMTIGAFSSSCALVRANPPSLQMRMTRLSWETTSSSANCLTKVAIAS